MQKAHQEGDWCKFKLKSHKMILRGLPIFHRCPIPIQMYIFLSKVRLVTSCPGILQCIVEPKKQSKVFWWPRFSTSNLNYSTCVPHIIWRPLQRVSLKTCTNWEGDQGMANCHQSLEIFVGWCIAAKVSRWRALSPAGAPMSAVAVRGRSSSAVGEPAMMPLWSAGKARNGKAFA